MTVVFYISAHGFGHATRSLETIEAIKRRAPHARVIIRSGLSASFARRSSKADFELQPADVDTGVVQHDSLTIDHLETARRAAVFYADFERRISEEAAHLKSVKGDVVVGDIPPLAFAASAEAGLPSIAVGNFTWDWIYESSPGFEVHAPAVLPMIRDAYACAGAVLRLPFHGGFRSMARIRDLPLIARKSRLNRSAARRAIGASDRDTNSVVLVSFGAYGATLPYSAVAREGRFTIVVTEHEMPEPDLNAPSALRRITVGGGTVPYKDLVAAADVVVSKPGYGIVSECIANEAALLYTPRGEFAEYGVFVAEMPRVLRCRSIDHDDLLGGRWASHLDALLAQPAPPEALAIDGAEHAAEAILAAGGDR